MVRPLHFHLSPSSQSFPWPTPFRILCVPSIVSASSELLNYVPLDFISLRNLQPKNALIGYLNINRPGRSIRNKINQLRQIYLQQTLMCFALGRVNWTQLSQMYNSKLPNSTSFLGQAEIPMAVVYLHNYVRGDISCHAIKT